MKHLLYILLLLSTLDITAQISAAIISPVDSVNVGQQFTVQLRITKPLNTTFKSIDITPLHNPITLQNAITPADDQGNWANPDFELSPLEIGSDSKDLDFIPYNEIEWVEDKSLGKSYLETSIDYLFWDPGVFKLKAVDFVLTDSNTTVLPLEATTIFVRPPVMNIDTTKQIPVKPIKNIIREYRTWKDFLPFLLGAILLFITIFYLIKLKNKNKDNLDAEFEHIEPLVAPDIKALEKLSVLKKEQLWQKGEIKIYQSRLTDIIREYISNRYGIPAMESTTDEISMALKKDNRFDTIYESQLKEILTMADMIKFAKAKPPADIHDRFMDTAVHFVNNTKSTIIEEEE